ncbi:MAG: amino acid permease [Dermatophilaceae bacterium]|nr:amino acid permease [Dermatophilaceae bacterium]
MSEPTHLHAGLKQRHLTMIAIGGVIGAGLFVGSGVVINETGPAAFLSYALAGVLIVMVMRMLGEMATADPQTGSFTEYARKALGGWAGFSAAWLYWYFWVIVVGFEAVAGAKILTFWFDAPLWLMSLVLMVLMTATNVFSVTSFGEFEFWFAGIKVATIIAFLALGTAFVLGLWPNKEMDFSNLTAHGGFLPHGASSIVTAIVVVIFSMVGAEIATIAAAESDNPKRAIAKATNSVVARILIFFVGSIFLLSVILPWNSTEVGASPYVSAMRAMGIPFADNIMNAVVLTAVLSCLNSGLYTASRMLFVLAGRREAPALMTRVSSRGVPVVAILTSTVVGYLCVIAAAISPKTIFVFLLNSSGAVILFVYLLIAISQVVLRGRTAPNKLIVKMWFHPVLSIVTIAAILGVLLQMYLDKLVRPQLVLSLLVWAVMLGLYVIIRWRQGSVDAAQPAKVKHKVNRVLVLANKTVAAAELLDELQRIDRLQETKFFVCAPAHFIDTGVTPIGGVWVEEASIEEARARLEDTLSTLRAEGLSAKGGFGDRLPMRALEYAVAAFGPDQIVIVTYPAESSPWLRHDIVERARHAYPAISVTHVIASLPAVLV